MEVTALPERPTMMPEGHGSVSAWLHSLAEGLEVQVGQYCLVRAVDAEGFRQLASYVRDLERHTGLRP